MNERIKELWIKAAESTAAYPSGQNNSWETQVNFLEKFAELIVRECASVVAEYCDPRFTWITPKTLLYHFGIKE